MESLRHGNFPLRAREQTGVPFCPHPLSPSPASRERGIMECGSEASAHAEADASALQTGQRAAPLSHLVGEGLGVRAKKKRVCSPRSEPKCCTLISCVPLSRGQVWGIMECGSEASAHAEADASALQTGQRAAPLSHSVRSDGFQHRLGVLVAERPLKLS